MNRSIEPIGGTCLAAKLFAGAAIGGRGGGVAFALYKTCLAKTGENASGLARMG